VLADLTHAVEARDEGAFSLIENEYRKVSDAEFRAALLNATERLTAAREQRRAAQLAEERAQEEAKRAAKLEEGKRVTEEQEKECDRPAEAYAANKIKEGGESDWHPSIPRFASVEAMMEEFGDYNKEEGTFAILSKKPLHIRVSRQVLPGDRADAVKGLNEMSLLFGVLRSFIHTPVEEITVTAYPIEYPKWPDTKNAKPLKEMALTLHAKRSDVFALISQIRPIKRFDDLLSVENGVYQPNKIYDAIYCDESSSHKPGRERFLRALAELPGAQVGTTTRKARR
jgi:cytochrome c5